MDLRDVILALVISYLGLAVGLLIARMAKEELKPGMRYFNALHNLLASVMVLIALAAVSWDFRLIGAAALATNIGLSFIQRPWKYSPYFYAVAGIALGTLSKNPTWFFMLVSIMFLYGVVLAALMSRRPVRLFYAHLGIFLGVVVYIFMG